MRRCILFLSFLLFACQQTPSIKPLLLDAQWFFQADSARIGIEQKWFASDFAHSRSIPANDFSDWDGWLPQSFDGVGWYFADITLERAERIALALKNADDEAVIYVNGIEVASHSGANIPFVVDLYSKLNPGLNRIAVRVTDFGGPGGLLHDVSFLAYRNAKDLQENRSSRGQSPKPPKWIRGAVIYEVNLRQFTPAGTVNAFTEQLPRLQELGVDILWFMPLQEIGQQKRKGTLGSPYSVRDYRSFNPEFGKLDDFKELVQQAHAMGMRVIIDWVANHTAWDHYWIEEHPDWYNRNAEGEIVAPIADWSDVADLDYNSSALRTAMIDAMVWWIRETDIDGFRCDVAEMVPLDFWRQATLKLFKEKEILMLAEGEHPDLHTAGFHLTYSSKLYWLLNRVVKGQAGAGEIDQLLAAEATVYPKGALRMRFTSNHDENSWNGSAPERLGEAVRACAVLTFAIHGVPLIYNGQEIGLNKRLEFFEKDPIDWQENALEEFYGSLARFVKQHHAVRDGVRIRLLAENESVYAFHSHHDSQEFVVVINFSPNPVRVHLPAAFFSFSDWFGGSSPSIEGLELESWGYRLYTNP
ncbi:alpha-amylase [candidate division KSB1 bacterium]|nr:alpha-amylase [candidate division KSB1 bacterium]